MPYAPKHPCCHPGCNRLVPGGEPRCDEHRKSDSLQYERHRGSPTARGYDSQWVKARKRFLADNPLCVECERQGIVRPATELDHIVPHRGNAMLFNDPSNYQGLCRSCHNAKTARGE